MRFHALLVLGLCFLAGWTLAQPEVLADFGGRTTDFPTNKRIQESLISARSIASTPVAPARVAPPSPFPSRAQLTVGVVEAKAHALTVVKPIFIIGPEAISIEWLIANKEHLASIGAQGIVTNVGSADTVARMRSQAPELMMSVVPVDEIAEAFGISHYPVLIDSEGIKQ